MGGGRHGGGRREPEEQRPDGKKILARISKETGGRMFKVSKKQPIDQIYSSQDELRNQYNLGFTPEKNETAGYHKLLLKAKPKDATVQAAMATMPASNLLAWRSFAFPNPCFQGILGQKWRNSFTHSGFKVVAARRLAPRVFWCGAWEARVAVPGRFQ